jgi:hypothetical protein
MSDLWSAWADLTRFLESASLAFARERALWESLELANRDKAKIAVQTGGRGLYKVRLDQHAQAVSDPITLYASVLIHCHALMDSAAADAMGVNRLSGGIEAWGTEFLKRNGRAWADVRDGLPGAVEVSVVRNAFAHGHREFGSTEVARLAQAGAPPRAAGDPVSLTYENLLLYRGRMQSLLNVGGLGTGS